MKKKVVIFMLIATIFSLSGCGSEESDKKEEKEVLKLEDVSINQPNSTYYTNGSNGRLYPCNDAILITTHNDYQCINTNVEFDEENGKYVCVIEFKKIIE